MVLILYCCTPEPVSLPVIVLYKNTKMIWNRNQTTNKVYMQFFFVEAIAGKRTPILWNCAICQTVPFPTVSELHSNSTIDKS